MKKGEKKSEKDGTGLRRSGYASSNVRTVRYILGFRVHLRACTRMYTHADDECTDHTRGLAHRGGSACACTRTHGRH